MSEQENISAGTQVVSRVEVRGPNNSRVHPRGAVGVVARTPAGNEKHFLVRFPDGFEFSLERDQLEVLKHFSHLPELPGEECRASLNDLLVRVRLNLRGPH